MLQTGDHIADRFEIEALLGEGGLAQVFRVRHLNLGTAHALKLLTLTHPSLVERLLQEGRIQAQLRHPNIVAVTDIVMHQGHPGLLMEFIEGETLEAALARGGPPPLDEALDMFSQVLAGVASAHAAGVLHRDLKPANILLARMPDGVVPKVTDFGIAKVARGGPGGTPLTRLGVTMGTPGYMAPEQSEDASTVDARADIFALGAILYELTTGRRAFPSSGVRETLNAAASADYIPPGQLDPELPPAVCDAIRVALSPRPEDRFADCVGFAVGLFAGQADRISRLTPSRVTPAPLPAFLWPRATPPATPSAVTGASSQASLAGDAPATLDRQAPPSVVMGTLAEDKPPPLQFPIKGWMVATALALMATGMVGAFEFLSAMHHAEKAAVVASESPVSAPSPVAAPPVETTPAAAPTPAPSASPSAAPPAAHPIATPPANAKTAAHPAPAATTATPAIDASAAPAEPAPALAEEPPVPTSGTGGTEVAAAPADTTVPDLKGAWVGEPWNMTILTQDDLKITGFIYRGAAGSRLPVTGAYNPETRTVVVRDASSAHYVLSATIHGDRLSGTFTQGEGDLSSRWSARKSR